MSLSKIYIIIFLFYYKEFYALLKGLFNTFLLTCTPLLFIFFINKRSISMCQAFGQRSFRAIIKLKKKFFLCQIYL